MLTQLEKADLALRLARLAKRPYNKHAGICANVIFAGTPLATVSHNKYF